MADGIRKLHSSRCPARKDRQARCRCRAGYEASVWSPRDRVKIRQTFPTLAEARTWRRDAAAAVGKGTLRAPRPTTVREAGEALIDGMRTGLIRNRSGDPYKPSAIRSYQAALERHIFDELGALKLAHVQRRHVQELADQIRATGRSPSTVRNALMPLRVIFRRAIARGDLAVNPCASLELAAVRGRRDRIVPPEEAAARIAALAENDRPLWATAFYAGLRRGELMGLDWPHVDLAVGVIRVERAYDPKERQFVDPKSQAGRRRVPIPAVLRDHLDEHKLRAGKPEGLVFGRTRSQPFDDDAVIARATSAWAKAKPPREPLTLHECRHTYASLMIAAGVNAKALATYMGHADVTITLNRYGHLMPGNEDEAAGLLDAYLERANTKARLAQLEGEASGD